MKIDSRSTDRLARLFLRGSRPRTEVDLPPDWQDRLMAEINDLASRGSFHDPSENRKEVFTDLLFRFAWAGGLAAVVLVIYAMTYGRELETQTYRLAQEHPDLSFFLDALI